MALTSPQMQVKVDKLVTNMTRWDMLVNGTALQTVTTDNGPQPTYAKWLADKSVEIDEDVEGYFTTANASQLAAIDAKVDKAEEWAEKATDSPVETGQFSAKHHATKAAGSATASELSKLQAAEIKTQAEDVRDDAIAVGELVRASSEASGNIRMFDTQAQAVAALGSLSSLQVVEVTADETLGGARTRYRVEDGSLVFKLLLSARETRLVDEFRLNPTESDNVVLERAFSTTAAGTLLKFDPRRVYLFDAAADAVNRDVLLDINGATLMRTGTTGVGGNDFIIKVRMDYSDITPVTSLVVVSASLGSGATALVSQLTVASGSAILSNLAVGDPIKVVADDLIPSSPAEDLERVGEHAYVTSITTTQIRLDRVLRETYSTNIRAGRMRKESVLIMNGRFTDQDGAKYRNLSALYVEGGLRPQLVNCRFEKLRARGVDFVSCMEPRTSICDFSDLETQESNNRYGYGIYEVSCCDGNHVAPSGRRLRHLYTTGTFSTTEADLRFERYGACIGSLISDASAVDCRGAALDTHADALGISFIGGSVRGGHNGDNTTQCNVQLRGRECVVDGVVSEGLTALKVISQNANDANHYVRMRHVRPAGFSSEAGAVKLEGKNTAPGGRIRLDLDLVLDAPTLSVIEVENMEVFIDHLRVDLKQTNVGGNVPRLVDLTNSTLRVRRMELDYRRSTGDRNIRLVDVFDTASVALIEEAIVLKGSAPGGWYVGDFSSQNGGRITAEMVKADVAPLSEGFINLGGSSCVAWADVVVNQRATVGPNFRAVSYAASGDKTLPDFSRCSQRDLFVHATVTNSSQSVVRTAVAGVFVGQRLHITNLPASTLRMSVAHNPSGLLSPSKLVTLYPGETLVLTWTGSVWAMGQAFADVERVAFVDNASSTLLMHSPTNLVYNTPLTNGRNITLPSTELANGKMFRITRTAAATGEFSLQIRDAAANSIARLWNAGSYAVLACDGTQWILLEQGVASSESPALRVHGNLSITATADEPSTRVFSTVLSAPRTFDLPTASPNKRFRIVRTAAATGSTLTINGTYSLAAGSWVDYQQRQDGTWFVTASGTGV